MRLVEIYTLLIGKSRKKQGPKKYNEHIFKMFYFLRHSDYEFNFVLFIQKSMKVSYFIEDYSILIYKLKFENNIRNTC